MADIHDLQKVPAMYTPQEAIDLAKAMELYNWCG